MEQLAKSIIGADAFVFVAGEYNWGMQPGLKNLTDHFLEEWFWRPAGLVSYSGGRLGGARSNYAWHPTLSEMGLLVISSTINVGPIAETLDEHGQPQGPLGDRLNGAFPKFADDLAWWAEAARTQRSHRAPPY
jgi:NAD(P)H-dependent FMN reductase